ncbi:glucose-6-phosphate isomerase family protein [Methanogenium organophilum]|uniref:glucose-6-phosphate isomerase n=1 Tax=Methanogenium organophilum TaxID=2199 RepID=A0A9X9T6Z4_METOG|nr:glucose-6-phosphate isomerase family protein [Methanogenium organophilum]WAI00833.1 glucose-6-phosphate isomerase [Methanogenium organophilum]
MDRYWKGPLPEPSVRTVRDMACVLADPDAVAIDPDTPLYYMYRDLAMNEEDREILSRQNLRYDITVIPPAMLGREYVKTKGHYHPDSLSGIGYPELYQVLAGRAYFLLQKKDLTDIIAVSADTGDCVFIPSDYGHITINCSDMTLVMANVVSNLFSSEYELYEQLCGGSYYCLKGNLWSLNKKWEEYFKKSIPSYSIVNANEYKKLFFDNSSFIYNLATEGECLLCLSEPERLPSQC